MRTDMERSRVRGDQTPDTSTQTHHGNMPGMLVSFAVDSNCADAESPCSAEHPTGDLSSIGHKDLVKQTAILAYTEQRVKERTCKHRVKPC